MDVWALSDLLDREGGPYHEFLRVEDLSVGLYRLGAGAVDRQQPHTDDEIYVVLAGHGRFTAGDDTRDVGPGDTIYVAAHVAHRFHDISEELQLIVVFAPPEDSRTGLTARYPRTRAVATRLGKASARRADAPSSSWRKIANTSRPSAMNGATRAAHASSSSTA